MANCQPTLGLVPDIAPRSVRVLGLMAEVQGHATPLWHWHSPICWTPVRQRADIRGIRGGPTGLARGYRLHPRPILTFKTDDTNEKFIVDVVWMLSSINPKVRGQPTVCMHTYIQTSVQTLPCPKQPVVAAFEGGDECI